VKARPSGVAVSESGVGTVGNICKTAYSRMRAAACSHVRIMSGTMPPITGHSAHVGRIPQPFRFDISPLGDSGHVLAGGPDEATVITKLEQIILAPQYQVGQLDANDSKLMARFRRRVADVQHLAGHMMSGNDYFVTSDHDDMLKKREQMWHAAGIAIVDPPEAVALARQRL
jgi:hypothetical protein